MECVRGEVSMCGTWPCIDPLFSCIPQFHDPLPSENSDHLPRRPLTRVHHGADLARVEKGGQQDGPQAVPP